ncbi:hypothetical protein FRC09_012230 [Ceratobasidium sp. 395]|nr:hypothetical protein FRC09_012230 [Ceratobasidium sp. 395]
MLKLYGGQPLSEATLFEWINEFRATTGKYLPVLLIFDIGRPSTSAPVVSTHELTNIYVIWACTPGESSYDANIDEDLPYSDLLKVLCLTLHKMRPSPPEIPKSVMRKITAQASRIVKIKRGINDIDTNTALDAMQPILRYVIEPVRRAAVDIVRNRCYKAVNLPDNPPRKVRVPTSRSVRRSRKE